MSNKEDKLVKEKLQLEQKLDSKKLTQLVLSQKYSKEDDPAVLDLANRFKKRRVFG